MAWALVAVACTGSTATTTTTTPPTTGASTTTAPAPTTTTEPLIPNGPALVGEGDSNELVAAVQFLLNCNGYGAGAVDGVYGPNTRSAIESVQRDMGREVTGGIDDETFAELARSCDETRRVVLDDLMTQVVVAGNTSAPDPDGYLVRVDEGATLTVTVSSADGGARAAARGVDGSSLGRPPAAVWAAEAPSTQDYLVEITTDGEATRYEATISVVDLGDRGSIGAADDDTVAVGDFEEAVAGVCRDTTGDDAFVAETPGAYLIVSAGAGGSRAIELGGIGAPVEVVFKDGSAGYYGFDFDLEVEVGDRVSGTARVFRLERGAHDDAVDLAFDFPVSVVPCGGEVVTSVVLSNGGIGVVDLGAANVEAAILTAQDALPGSSPLADTGWFDLDPEANDFGVCRASMTEARVVTIDNLTLFFADGGTEFAPPGTRHLVAWSATEGLFPLSTAGGVGPGSTVAEVLAAHPDAAVVAAGGGVRIYVSSAPGSDAWLWGEAPGAAGVGDATAVVTTFHGGRFCDR